MPPLTKVIESWNRAKAAITRISIGDGGNSSTAGEVSRKARGPVSSVLFVGLVGGDGGTSVFMEEVALLMAEQGIQVKIVVPSSRKTELFQKRCFQRGIPVELTEWLTDPQRPGSFILFRRHLNAIRFVRKFRAPIVHYHLGGVSALPHYLLRAMKVLRIPPVFVTAHNNCDDPRPEEPWARYWATAAVHRLRKVICVSRRGVQRQLQYGITREQIEYIPNGIDIAAFENGDAARAHRDLGLPDNVRLIVSSARIEPGKRPLDALDSFRLISSEFPDTHLVFVGYGSLMQDVMEAAEWMKLSERVHLVGYRFNISDWLAASTVWLMPTESEGFSLAVLEAMAAGCAIITTNSPGNDELVVNDHNALVTDVGDVSKMGEALRLLLTDELRRARLGRAARETAQQFSIDRVVKSHLACYAGQAGLQSPEALSHE